MAAYRVLIVEDHRELARMLRTGIESLDAPISAVDVPSGEEALLDATRNQPDLAIIDLRLPGMDGVKLAQRLRKRYPQVKIFLISGLSDEEIERAVATIQPDAWFRKPLELADMLDAVERHLGLVEGFLGQKPRLSLKEEEKTVERMTDLLADLREHLQARGVALLDDVGRVALQAGTLPPTCGQEVLSMLVALHATGGHLNRLLEGEEPRYHFYLHTDEVVVHLRPLNAHYALLVLCVEQCRALPLDEVVSAIQKAVGGLQRAMARLGLLSPLRAAPPSPSAPATVEKPLAEETEAAPPPEPAGEGLVGLLEQNLPLEEADRFWEQTENDAPPAHALNPDALSYEQARKLGLAPGEESSP